HEFAAARLLGEGEGGGAAIRRLDPRALENLEGATIGLEGLEKRRELAPGCLPYPCLLRSQVQGLGVATSRPFLGAHRNLVLLTKERDGVVDDAAMTRIVEALLDQPLGDGDGEIRDLSAEVLPSPPHILIELLPRAGHEACRLGLRGIHEPALLIRRFLEGLGADALRLGAG